MSQQTQDEVMGKLRGHCARAGQKHEAKLRDQAIALIDHHRKAAIRQWFGDERHDNPAWGRRSTRGPSARGAERLHRPLAAT